MNQENSQHPSQSKHESDPGATKIVFCIALEGDGPTGVDWYRTAEERDAASGSTGATTEIRFNLRVPAEASKEDVDRLADVAAWEKSYIPIRRIPVIGTIGANHDVERADDSATEQQRDTGVMQFLDICSNHLSRPTFAFLEAAQPTGPHCLGLTIAPYEFGAFVTVPSDSEHGTKIDALQCPDDLKVVLKHARSIGCALLRFDTEGGVVRGLPLFNW